MPTQGFRLPYFNYDLVWHPDIVELTNWNILAVNVLQKIQNEILFYVCNFYFIEEKYNHFLKIHWRKKKLHMNKIRGWCGCKVRSAKVV